MKRLLTTLFVIVALLFSTYSVAGWKTKASIFVTGFAIKTALKSPEVKRMFVRKIIDRALQEPELMSEVNKIFDKFMIENLPYRDKAQALIDLINKYYKNVASSYKYPNSPIALYEAKNHPELKKLRTSNTELGVYAHKFLNTEIGDGGKWFSFNKYKKQMWKNLSKTSFNKYISYSSAGRIMRGKPPENEEGRNFAVRDREEGLNFSRKFKMKYMYIIIPRLYVSKDLHAEQEAYVARMEGK